MRTLTKTVKIRIYTFSELGPSERKLFNVAISARKYAQAPYSHYQVGCAVLYGNNCISSGVNVERNTWTQTTHAEQNAIDSAIAKVGPVRLHAIAVVGAPEGQEILREPIHSDMIGNVDQVCPSCGHCLQIILENCFGLTGEYDPNVALLGTHNGEFYRTTIGDALPMPFLPQYLGTNYAETICKAQKIT